MQTYSVNYWEIYALIVNWISIRFLLKVSQVLKLNTQAINFTFVFPQADLEVPVHMKFPAGADLAGNFGKCSQYVLKLRKSLHGLKQASLI